MAESVDKSNAPPYVPFDTFRSFIDILHKTAVPPHIDRSIMPKLSGAMQKQVISALKFLKLIGPGGDTFDGLRTLVKAFGTDQWADAMTQLICDSYEPIIGEMDIDTASSKQLMDAFRVRGHVDGQMLDKAVRFYIRGLREAGMQFSPHFSVRKSNGAKRAYTPRKPKNAQPEHGQETGEKNRHDEFSHQKNPLGTIQIPIYLPGKATGSVIVPEDLSVSDCEMIDAILRAYAKRRTENK